MTKIFNQFLSVKKSNFLKLNLNKTKIFIKFSLNNENFIKLNDIQGLSTHDQHFSYFNTNYNLVDYSNKEPFTDL